MKQLASNQDLRIRTDPDWAQAKAAGLETPQGVVHMHWMNHRGRGHWNLVKKPVGQLCLTACCRVVTIIPHGGENESAPIKQKPIEALMNQWMDEKDKEYKDELQRVNSSRSGPSLASGSQ